MTLNDALGKGLIRILPTKEDAPLGSRSPLSRLGTTEGLENLDPQRRPMTIHVTEPIALESSATSSIDKLARLADLSRARAASNQSGGSLTFRETWRALDTLRRAGYGEAGEPDTAFAAAVSRFQVENGLSPSAELDRPTLNALHQHRKIANFLSASATASSDMYRAMHVIFVEGARFRVLGVDGPYSLESVEAFEVGDGPPILRARRTGTEATPPVELRAIAAE